MATNRNLHVAYEYGGEWCQQEETYEKEDDEKYLQNSKHHGFVEVLKCKGKMYPGIGSRAAINIYGHLLSPYEMNEIKQYPTVYCMSEKNNEAPLDAMKKGFFWKDDDDFKLVPGEHISYRYKIDKLVGGFDSGKVAYATDAKTKQKVAIKVMSKSAKQTFRACRCLIKLGQVDPTNARNWVRMLHFDSFRGAHYIVMDRYDTDLKRYMDEHYPTGMPMEDIARYAFEMLIALEMLEILHIIHGDIKPNSWLLNRDDPFKVKLADFTLCRPEKKSNRHIKCQTMNYRAPEIFLHRRETCAVDMWAFGCVIAELVTNVVFFIGANCHDQFFLYLEVLGIPPDEFFERKDTATFFFSTLDKVPVHVINRNGKDVVDLEYSYAARRRKIPGATPLKTFFRGEEYADVLDFLRKTFKWIPSERITASQALHHPIVRGYSYSSTDSAEETKEDATAEVEKKET